mgnify:CR=1 FL=1
MESTKRDYGPIMLQFVLPGKPSGERCFAALQGKWRAEMLSREECAGLSCCVLPGYPLKSSRQAAVHELLGPLSAPSTPPCHLTLINRLPSHSECSLRPGRALHEDPQGREELRALALVPRRRPGQLVPDPPALSGLRCASPGPRLPRLAAAGPAASAVPAAARAAPLWPSAATPAWPSVQAFGPAASRAHPLPAPRPPPPSLPPHQQ